MSEPEAESLMDFSEMFVAPGLAPGMGGPPRRVLASAPAAACDELPCLSLQHMHTPPLVQFDDVPARASATRELIVRNEGSRMQRVTVKGVDTRDVVSVYPAQLDVDAHGEGSLSLT